MRLLNYAESTARCPQILARDEDGRLQRQTEAPLVMQIPEGLRDVIGKRISRLSAECNRVLAVAAVIGRDFAFETLTAVADGNKNTIVVAGEAEQLPPALVVQPGEDANVPVEMTFDLLRAWQSRGGHIEYAHFPGMPHAFGARPSPQTDDMIRLVHNFVLRHATVRTHTESLAV